MSKKLYIKRHISVINRVKKSPCSFFEIQSYLEKIAYNTEEDFSLSKRTFERDLV